ncbi:Uncharacterised protein [Chlamydia trachomatis]|nr:Uncharacterised protein [Chlamydia trachomatis]
MGHSHEALTPQTACQMPDTNLSKAFIFDLSLASRDAKIRFVLFIQQMTC